MSELTQAGLALLSLPIALVSLPNHVLARLAPLPIALAWRCRLASLAFVAAFLLATRGLFPAPELRDGVQYVSVLTLGYGHLFGSAWFARHRMAAAVPAGVPGWLFAAFLATNVLVLFYLYGWVSQHFASELSGYSVALFFFMFAVSNWHVVENDLAAASAYLRDGKLDPLTTQLRENLPIACSTLAITGTGFYLYAHPTAWLTFADFFTALVLYHLIAWLIFFGDRARSLPWAQARTLLARVVCVHAPPAVLAIGLIVWSIPELDAVRYALFAPGPYAFLSTLHVVQSAWVRGFEPGHA